MDAMPTKNFAIVFFLLVLLCTSTSATAQFLPGNELKNVLGPYQNPVAVSLVENGGTIALKVQLTGPQCIPRMSAFAQLERLISGDWVPQGPQLPVQLGNFGRGPLDKTLRTAGVFMGSNNESFPAGDYRLISFVWSIGDSENTKCPVSQYITYKETPHLHIGAGFNGKLSSVGKASIPSLNDGKLDFQAILVSRTRLTIFQEFGSEKVVGFSEDYPAGNSTIRTNLHPEFRPGLSIKVHILDLESGDSTVATLFEPTPNVRFNALPRNTGGSQPEWQ